MAANVETMAYNGNVAPWHGLGTSVGNARTSDEMLVLAGLDWTVSARPLFIEGNGVNRTGLVTLADAGKTFDKTEIEGYVAIVRDKDERVYGVQTSGYQTIQNGDIFAIADTLINRASHGTERAVFETAGSLNYGARVWASIRLGDLKIFDDDYQGRVTIFGGHDGKVGVGAMRHVTRVVCNNTLNAALRESPARWARRHVGKSITVDQLVREADEVLKLSEEYNDAVKATAERLFKVKLSGGDLSLLLNEVYPVDATIADDAIDADEIKRIDVMRRMKAPDLANFSNTGWAFVQALSDHVFHFAQRQTATLQEKRMGMVLNGAPTLERGMVAIEAMAERV